MAALFAVIRRLIPASAELAWYGVTAIRAMTTLPDGGDVGFRIVSGALGSGEMSQLLRTLEASPLTRSRAGARHLMKDPAVSDVANDPRLLEIARRFLGSSTVPFRATLFDKSSARNWLVSWHQDTALPLQERRDVPGWGPWSTKAEITYAHAPVTALARVVAAPALRRPHGKITGRCVSFPERMR